MKPKLNIPSALYISAWFATIACAFPSHASAQNITGDTVQGNLTVTGNTTSAGWGLFKQGVDLGGNGEVMLNWWPGTSPVGTATFDINWADGTFTWRDTVSSTASNKMTLDAANSLILYKSNGSVGISLAPESGRITLPAGNGTTTGSGIYFGTNTTATLAATSTGTAIFPSQVTLQNGLSVSSGTMTVASTTAASSSSSGALTVAGGLGVAKDSWINGVRIGKGFNGISTNTAYGQMVLDDNTSGTNNTSTGAYSLVRNTSGSNNSSFGAYAQQFGTTGTGNSAFGSLALNYNNGNYNTAVGSRALLRKTNGSNNVAAGYTAGEFQENGSFLSSASNSIYLGANTRGKDDNDSNSIVIGANAVGAGANTTVIGNSSTTQTHLYGETKVHGLRVTGQVIIEQTQGDISMGIYQ